MRAFRKQAMNKIFALSAFLLALLVAAIIEIILVPFFDKALGLPSFVFGSLNPIFGLF